MENMIIFSAGDWGEHAFIKFRNYFNIICFVDNNAERWGTELFGVKVCSPDILADHEDCVIAIANQNYYEEIFDQIIRQYGFRRIIPYRLSEYDTYYDGKVFDSDCSDNGEVVIEFDQGIGGMLYQYGFLLYLRLNGVNAVADFSFFDNPIIVEYERRLGYYDPHDFLETFKSIVDDPELVECHPKLKINRFMNMHRCLFGSDYYFSDSEYKKLDYSSIYNEYSFFHGFGMPLHLLDSIRDEFLAHIHFPAEEKNLISIAEKIKNDNYVGVHFRRGDFLEADAIKIFGGICTKQYYDHAIEYIRSHVGNVKFVFFSNDIEWVKNEMHYEDAIYIEDKIFEEYRDWYDLYLMSICKHNIVANSQFSMWGAWLNENPDKIVIAPTEKTRGQKLVPPKGWVLIGPN